MSQRCQFCGNPLTSERAQKTRVCGTCRRGFEVLQGKRDPSRFTRITSEARKAAR